jgi:hypothetical protein
MGDWCTGMHHTRTVPPGRALRVQDAGSPNLTRTCTHTNSKYPASSGGFQPAQWTPVPAGAGTMCHPAGKIRPPQLPGVPFLCLLSAA